VLLWVHEKGKGMDGAGGYRVDSIEEAVDFFIENFPYDNMVGFIAEDNKNNSIGDIICTKNKFKRLVKEANGGDFLQNLVL
jgi:hypothetical protein